MEINLGKAEKFKFLTKNNKGHRKASFAKETWSKLKRNIPAMIGIVIIFAAILISILGANIRPDSSPDANNQIYSIARMNPGFEVTIIKVRKNNKIEKVSFLEKLFFGGQPKSYEEIPILNYEFKGSDVIIEEYSSAQENDSYTPSYQSYSIVDVLFPLSIEKTIPYEMNNDGTIKYWLLDGTQKSSSLEQLRNKVVKNNIENVTYYLGTDKQGRDMLSRLMAGTIVSLSVGLIAVLISLVIGLFFGALAGFYRGWVDDIIMFIINLVWSIPGLLLIISITLIIGKGFTTIFFAVGLTMWVELARMVRGQIMSIRELDYIEAGRALGYGDARLIWKHVLPNIMGPVIVICASNFAAAILIEAGLSFLGIGVQLPTPSWGFMIEQHKGLIMDPDKAYMALLPGIFIIMLVFAFMTLGNGLRDAFDTRENGGQIAKSQLKGAPVDNLHG